MVRSHTKSVLELVTKLRSLWTVSWFKHYFTSAGVIPRALGRSLLACLCLVHFYTQYSMGVLYPYYFLLVIQGLGMSSKGKRCGSDILPFIRILQATFPKNKCCLTSLRLFKDFHHSPSILSKPLQYIDKKPRFLREEIKNKCDCDSAI